MKSKKGKSSLKNYKSGGKGKPVPASNYFSTKKPRLPMHNNFRGN